MKNRFASSLALTLTLSALSSTVIADTVMDADALSTALFIMGPNKGISLINSLEGVEGMILSKSGSASYSSGFGNLPGLSLQGLENDLSKQVATK